MARGVKMLGIGWVFLILSGFREFLADHLWISGPCFILIKFEVHLLYLHYRLYVRVCLTSISLAFISK